MLVSGVPSHKRVKYVYQLYIFLHLYNEQVLIDRNYKSLQLSKVSKNKAPISCKTCCFYILFGFNSFRYSEETPHCLFNNQ